MNQVKIDAMQEVLPVEKRVVFSKAEPCISLFRLHSICKLNDDGDYANTIRGGEEVWVPIRTAIFIIANSTSPDPNLDLILEYLQSFDETHEVAE
jgi:hypothetical protein